MKKIIYSYPESSFLSTEKDMGIIVDTMLKNNRLKKMLYYNSRDCLQQQQLTDEQSLSLFGKNIRIVPKLDVDGTVQNYIVINFDNFTPNDTNSEFRDNIIEFDIICHFDQWQMQDFELRPYKIAAEIDAMFNNKHLTGIGTLHFIGANQMILSGECGGLCIMYQAIHGDEDKKGMPNPLNEESFIADYDAMYNNH